jgi:SET domain-containing protein
MYTFTNAQGRREDILLDDPQHPEYDSVRIGPSSVAGQGLFARKDFKKGDFICQYWGDLVKTSVATRDDYQSDYLFQLTDKWTIDGKDPNSCYARYVNDPIRSGKYNAAFVVAYERELRSGPGIPGLVVVAIKDIQAGQEIFAAYGNDYWADEHFGLLNRYERLLMYRRSQKVRRFVNARPALRGDFEYIDEDLESDPDLQPPTGV